MASFLELPIDVIGVTFRRLSRSKHSRDLFRVILASKRLQNIALGQLYELDYSAEYPFERLSPCVRLRKLIISDWKPGLSDRSNPQEFVRVASALFSELDELQIRCKAFPFDLFSVDSTGKLSTLSTLAVLPVAWSNSLHSFELDCPSALAFASRVLGGCKDSFRALYMYWDDSMQAKALLQQAALCPFLESLYIHSLPHKPFKLSSITNSLHQMKHLKRLALPRGTVELAELLHPTEAPCHQLSAFKQNFAHFIPLPLNRIFVTYGAWLQAIPVLSPSRCQTLDCAKLILHEMDFNQHWNESPGPIQMSIVPGRECDLEVLEMLLDGGADPFRFFDCLMGEWKPHGEPIARCNLFHLVGLVDDAIVQLFADYALLQDRHPAWFLNDRCQTHLQCLVNLNQLHIWDKFVAHYKRKWHFDFLNWADCDGETLIVKHIADALDDHSSLEDVSLLLDRGADPCILRKDGTGALYDILDKAFETIPEDLIERIATSSAQVSSIQSWIEHANKTPAVTVPHWARNAARGRSEKLWKIFKDHITAELASRCLIEICMDADEYEAEEFGIFLTDLIELGADLNFLDHDVEQEEPDSSHFTRSCALLTAARNGYNPAVDLLLSHGCDPFIQTSQHANILSVINHHMERDYEKFESLFDQFLEGAHLERLAGALSGLMQLGESVLDLLDGPIPDEQFTQDEIELMQPVLNSCLSKFLQTENWLDILTPDSKKSLFRILLLPLQISPDGIDRLALLEQLWPTVSLIPETDKDCDGFNLLNLTIASLTYFDGFYEIAAWLLPRLVTSAAWPARATDWFRSPFLLLLSKSAEASEDDISRKPSSEDPWDKKVALVIEALCSHKPPHSFCSKTLETSWFNIRPEQLTELRRFGFFENPHHQAAVRASLHSALLDNVEEEGKLPALDGVIQDFINVPAGSDEMPILHAIIESLSYGADLKRAGEIMRLLIDRYGLDKTALFNGETALQFYQSSRDFQPDDPIIAALS